jgi:two-component system, OmpR family, KDP operon response regulator KdpE
MTARLMNEPLRHDPLAPARGDPVSGAAAPIALVVEDDPNIRRSVATSLRANGWTVHEVGTLRQALQQVHDRLDLAIVDLGLPDGDGVDLIGSLRHHARIPIIVLSARSEEHDKVRALDAGADDYVEKPFRVAEFLARVRAHMRRRGDVGAGEQRTVVLAGNIEFDRHARVVRKDGEEVHLTKTEYRLFDFLVDNAGRVLTHRQLLREVWGPARVEHNEYLRVFMAALRQKLEDDPAQPRLITTETAVGYRLIAA